jgi:hypothetical protein
MPKGFYIRTEENQKNHRKAMNSLEVKRKLSFVGKLRKFSEETRRKMSESQKGHIGYMLGKHHTKESKLKISKNHARFWLNKKNPFITGENNSAWKAEDASYRAKHYWIERKLGKPKFCEECGNKNLNHRQYNWANISKKYYRIITDWKRMCVSCHRLFDKKVYG